jgi:hypothetical protein
VDSPLHEHFPHSLCNASSAHAEALSTRRAGKEIVSEYYLDSNPISVYYLDSSYEFDFWADPDELESENHTTEQLLSGSASGLVITFTPAGRFVYWPDRKPADLTDGNSRCVAYLDSLPFQEGTPLAPAEEHTPIEVATGDSSLGSPDRQLFITTNESRNPQGHTLADISRISQQTSCLPTHPQTRPTPTTTPDVNATEGGTNGADVSASPYPYRISQRLSTKSKTGCTLPQSNASCLSPR